jgi:hypothetical protein
MVVKARQVKQGDLSGGESRAGVRAPTSEEASVTEVEQQERRETDS